MESNSFPIKLYNLLDDAERFNFTHIICWNPDGRSFHIKDPEGLTDILPAYTRITKYKSLLRQLQHYGFTRIIKGSLQGHCWHEKFQRYNKADCAKMRRVPSGERRKSDPNLFTHHGAVAALNRVVLGQERLSSQSPPAHTMLKAQRKSASSSDLSNAVFSCTAASISAMEATYRRQSREFPLSAVSPVPTSFSTSSAAHTDLSPHKVFPPALTKIPRYISNEVEENLASPPSLKSEEVVLGQQQTSFFAGNKFFPVIDHVEEDDLLSIGSI